jgi:hypothetical protein
MDFVLLGGRMKTILNEARDIFPVFKQAKSLRRREDGSIRKITTWWR